MENNKTELHPWKKAELLENAVFELLPEDLAVYYEKLGKVEITAKVLGMACRLRGAEWVKVLVEHGADFRYDRERLQQLSGQPLRVKINFSLWLMVKAQYYYGSPKLLSHLPSVGERLKTLEYLTETADKTGFDKDEFLYYAIMYREKEMTEFLKSAGAKLPEAVKKTLTDGSGSNCETEKRFDLCSQLRQLYYDDCKACVSELVSMTGSKLYFDNWMMSAFCALNERKMTGLLKLFLDHFNIPEEYRLEMMKLTIQNGTSEELAAAAELGWLARSEDREDLIKYSAECKKTECTAFLLNFQNKNSEKPHSG